MSVTRANQRAATNTIQENEYEVRKLQDLSSEQVQAFRTAFDHIGSRIKASTGWLQEAMKSINVSLSSQQLQDILYAAAEDVTGKRIEFEEFVFLSLFLTRYFQEINGASERGFTKSATLIQPKLHRREKPLKMPHVISHYAAGIRLEGASEAKMVREIIRLRQASVENSKSPYAELLVLNYFNNRFISHKKVGMQTESSSAEKCITTKFHQQKNSTLPQIDTKHPNHDFHITMTDEVLLVGSKRPHSCKAKIINISSASPTVIKQRLKRTIKDYRFYSMGS